MPTRSPTSRPCSERGVDVDDFAPRLSWIFNTHINFFEEIAKYRTLRRLWAQIMSERFGAKDPRSMMLRTHTQTGGSTLTAQQPENNIVRAAIQALAAVARRRAVDGAVVLRRGARDPDREGPEDRDPHPADRRRRRSASTDTIDPLAGSYYVEWLTNELQTRAVEEMEKIEKMGGAVEAIESGYYHKAILDEAYKWEQDVNTGERVVVGVNKYRDDDEPEPEYFKVDPSLADMQRAKLEKLRDERDSAAAEKALAGTAHGRRGQREHDAGDHRGGARLLHARRDLRLDEGRLRRVQGACGDLACTIASRRFQIARSRRVRRRTLLIASWPAQAGASLPVSGNRFAVGADGWRWG